jgi:hypothetical protein
MKDNARRIESQTRRNIRQRRRFMVRLGHTSSFTANVSDGGFSIGLMKVLPMRADVEGSIQVEGEEMPFAGRVAWAKPGDHHQGLRGTMGVYFTRISADFPRLIDSLRHPAGHPLGAVLA